MVAKLSCLAPWYGAKRTLAPKIVEIIGKHRGYFEPFCASMAVLFAKPPCSAETVNDLHGDVINLARVVQSDAAPDLYDRLQRTLFSEAGFRETAVIVAARGHSPAPEVPDVERAYGFFVTSWQGMNGYVGTRNKVGSLCAKYTAVGGQPAVRFRNMVDKLPAWHERLRNVCILNRDAFEVIDRIKDEEGTAIYCDPPYLTKSAAYAHDFEESGHRRLAASLRRFKAARVAVSYYAHPLLDELYADWWLTDLEARKYIMNVGDAGSAATAGKTAAPEVLLTNWEPKIEVASDKVF